MLQFEQKGMKDSRGMQVGEYFFQGDVVVKKVKSIPEFESADWVENNVLAKGEATGHVHKVKGNCRVIKNPTDSNDMYLDVIEDSELYHQEHSPIKIGPGFYKVEIQREYNHFFNIIDLVYD